MTIEITNDLRPTAMEWPKHETTESNPVLARAFDAYFLQSMQKSARMEQHFIQDSNPLAGSTRESISCLPDTYQGTGEAEPSVEAPPADLPGTPAPICPVKGASDFINKLWPYAAQAARLTGIDPRLLLAQAALETGWGRHIAEDNQGVSSNNLFNIKASKADSRAPLAIKTTEYVNGKPIRQTASFKTYPSVYESFQDYLDLIQGSARYQDALAHANDPEAYAHALQAAGYATDPEYADKILSVYHSLVEQEPVSL